MKKWGRIIALALVLVALVVAYVVLTAKPSGTTGAQGTPSPSASASPNPDEVKLFDFNKADVVKIVFKFTDGDVAMTQKDSVVESQTQNSDGTTSTTTQNVKIWVTDGFKLDSSVGDNVAGTVDSASTYRLIDPDPKDLSIYGLDKPSVVALYNAEGKEESLEVGNKTPTDNAYYVRKGGDKAVYTLLSYTGDYFKVSRIDMISKQIYHKDNLLDTNMSALTFYKDGAKEFDSRAIDQSKQQWQITYPLDREADYTDLSKYLTGLAGISSSISKIVEQDPPDLKIYGLDKPKYEFSYTLDGKAYDLKVGSTADSAYYCMISGDYNLVFLLNSSALNFAELRALDLMDRFAYLPSIWNVSKVVIELDGRKDTMEMNVGQPLSDKDTYSFNGQKVEGEDNQSLFRKYYQAVIGLSGDQMDINAKPQGEPFARVSYTDKASGKDTTVELIPTPDDYGYYLMKDGQYTGMIMGKRQLDKADMGVRVSYQNLAKAFNITK